MSTGIAHAQKGELAVAAVQAAVAVAETLYDRLSSIDRGVVVTIENRTGKTLKWAGTYEFSGSISDYSREIPSQTAGFVIASKSQGSFGTGAVGVFRYRLGDSPQTFEIMYSVPYDYNLYSNLFNGNIVNSAAGPDRRAYDSAYKHSYYAGKDTPTETPSGYIFSMSMTTNGKAKLNVRIQ
ncbi:MAG: hypothetical protein ACKV2U_16430 [Bryobacteraceae bacterium]